MSAVGAGFEDWQALREDYTLLSDALDEISACLDEVAWPDPYHDRAAGLARTARDMVAARHSQWTHPNPQP